MSTRRSNAARMEELHISKPAKQSHPLAKATQDVQGDRPVAHDRSASSRRAMPAAASKSNGPPQVMDEATRAQTQQQERKKTNERELLDRQIWQLVRIYPGPDFRIFESRTHDPLYIHTGRSTGTPLLVEPYARAGGRWSATGTRVAYSRTGDWTATGRYRRAHATGG